MTKQAASKLVTSLEDAGYVRRVAHGSDGRAKAVTLTARGGDLLATVEEIYAEIEAEWAAVLGGDGSTCPARPPPRPAGHPRRRTPGRPPHLVTGSPSSFCVLERRWKRRSKYTNGPRDRAASAPWVGGAHERPGELVDVRRATPRGRSGGRRSGRRDRTGSRSAGRRGRCRWSAPTAPRRPRRRCRATCRPAPSRARPR